MRHLRSERLRCRGRSRRFDVRHVARRHRGRRRALSPTQSDGTPRASISWRIRSRTYTSGAAHPSRPPHSAAARSSSTAVSTFELGGWLADAAIDVIAEAGLAAR